MKIVYFMVMLCCTSLFASQVQASDNQELTNAVLNGRLEFFRSCAISSPLTNADYQSTKEVTYFYSSGIDYAVLNGIIENEDYIHSQSTVENAINYFATRKLPFMWWTDDKNLELSGFQFGGIWIGIALDISSGIPVQQVSSSVQIKIITSYDELHTFSSILVEGFGMKSEVLDQFQHVLTGAMNNDEQIHFLATVDNMPAGIITLVTAETTAGIWNMVSLPKYRKMGVGTALVKAALVEAYKQQYQYVIAMLMPKGMAWGVFEKLGFKAVKHFSFYVYGSSAEELEK